MSASFSDPRDRIMALASPILPCPRFSELPALDRGCHRFLLAADGVFLEARSKVLHACVRVGEAAALPYGTIQPFLRVAGGDLVPRSLMERAKRLAEAALPNEWAGALVQRRGEVVLHIPPVLAASRDSITYSVQDLDPMAVLIDLHSHGRHAAFFSSQDDRDDLANPSPVFVSGVIGRLGCGAPEVCLRVMVMGRPFSLALEPLTWGTRPEPSPVLMEMAS